MSPKICSDEEDEEAASFDVKDVADGNDDKANKLDKTNAVKGTSILIIFIFSVSNHN